MIFGFSSIGAPDLGVTELSDLGRQHRMDFLELRTVEGTIHLWEHYRKNPAAFSGASLPIQLLASDLRLATADEQTMTDFLNVAALADILGAPYVRVFGGWKEGGLEDNLKAARQTVLECRRLMRLQKISCSMLLETHSEFSSSDRCLRLLAALDEPLGILWDSHHTWKWEGEKPEQTWKTLGPHIRHIHYKDSRPEPSAREGYAYVLPGEGDYPGSTLFRLLREQGYRHGVSLEWEKLWHPELPDLTEALPGFEKICRGQDFIRT